MFHKLGNLFLIAALLASTGGHWALLQSVAWTTMLAGHLQSESFTAAMENTFNGRHPCKMCLAIAAAKKAEKKSEFTLSQQKIEFPPLSATVRLYAPTTFKLSNNPDTFAESSSLPPPVPPPRTVPV